MKVLLYGEFETKEVNINLLVIKLNIKAINNINRLQKKTFINVYLSHIEHQKLQEIKRNWLQVAQVDKMPKERVKSSKTYNKHSLLTL